MKANIFKSLGLLFISFSLVSCGIQKNNTSGRMHLETHQHVAEDSTEYKIIIFDNDFERWLITQPENINYYSAEYLKSRNSLYSDSWNMLYTLGDRRVQSYIDYDRNIDYGKEVDFKLFMYFKYFQEKYRINLLTI